MDLQDHAAVAVVCGPDSHTMTTLQHFAQLGAEAVVEPGVEERVAAGRAHGAQVAQQLDEQEVALVDQLDVNVPQHVEDVDGEPAHREGGDQERNQAEDLPLPSLVGPHLALAPVARGHTFPQFDSDAEVGDKDGGQREHVGHQQGAVGVGASLSVLTQPELLTDGEALVLELHVVGVQDGGTHQAAGEQPDADQHGGAGGHGGALLQRVDRCVISASGRSPDVLSSTGSRFRADLRLLCVRACVCVYLISTHLSTAIAVSVKTET